MRGGNMLRGRAQLIVLLLIGSAGLLFVLLSVVPGIVVGLAMLCGMAGVPYLLARFLMPDGGPSDRAQTLYVVVFCALAGIVCLVQWDVGHAKFQHHPAWTHPFTVLGTASMMLGRVLLEGTHLLTLALLPLGLLTQACLWFPLLLGRPGKLGWVKPLVVQLLWGGVWLALSLWLCREAYRFYA